MQVSAQLHGGELTYRCTGGNNYEVTYTYYRDCHRPTPPANIYLIFNCLSNAGLNFSIQVPKLAGTGNEITNVCSSVQTRCSSTVPSLPTGIEEHLYRIVVSLPICDSWRIAYNGCCRNPTNNIQNPITTPLRLEATLNNSKAPCASSPVFSNIPVTYLFKDRWNTISFNAIDPDGDSLSYELVSPMSGINQYVTHTAGYSAANPLHSNPPLQFDAESGIMQLHPEIEMLGYVACRVSKWRRINDTLVKIGTISRDYLHIISNQGPNQPPLLGGIDKTMGTTYNPLNTDYETSTCHGQALSFTIHGFDPDTFNSSYSGNPERFKISWNSGIPGATFYAFQNGTSAAYASFIWTPPASAQFTNPNCFTATISDEACPFNSVRHFRYCINVISHTATLNNDTLLCQGESFTVNANAGPFTTHFRWQLNGTPLPLNTSASSFTFSTDTLSPGLHELILACDDGSPGSICTAHDTMFIRIVTQPKINLPSDTILCGKSLTLTAGPGHLFYWSVGSFSQTITIVPPFNGQVWVGVDGGQNTRCVDMDTIDVILLPDIQAGLGEITGPAVSPPGSLAAYTTSLNPPWIKNWKVFGGYIAGGHHDDTVLVRWFPLVEGRVIIEAIDQGICFAHDTLNVIIGYTGLSEVENAGPVIYPNPVQTELYIHTATTGIWNFEIFDNTGRVVRKEVINGGSAKVSVQGLSAGLYSYRLCCPLTHKSHSGRLSLQP